MWMQRVPCSSMRAKTSMASMWMQRVLCSSRPKLVGCESLSS